MADASKVGIRGLGTVGISVFGFYVKKQKVWLPTVEDQSKLLLLVRMIKIVTVELIWVMSNGLIHL